MLHNMILSCRKLCPERERKAAIDSSDVMGARPAVNVTLIRTTWI